MYNKVIMVGNLTRDPELSYLPNQTAVVKLGLATNRKFKKQDGTKGEEVCFVDCVMFGKRAETVNKYFAKGNRILVEGRLKYESWQAQDGSKRSKHVIMMEGFQFIDKASTDAAPPPKNDEDIPF